MQRENEVQHVFLVGAKSLGAYGGFKSAARIFFDYDRIEFYDEDHAATSKTL